MKKIFLAKIDKKVWLSLFLIIVFCLFLRLWHLGKIDELIFDEVYFVDFAKNYLGGISFFDIHPPLGKLIIALGIRVFGDNPFGWRVMAAIFGTALVFLGYLTGKELGGKRVGVLSAIILALDGLLLVYSRVGLIDIFLVFFVVFSFYLFLKFSNSKKLPYLILAGVVLGLAASVKYIGALLILVFILMIFVKKIPIKKSQFIVFLIIVPIIIYLGFFLFNFRGWDFFSQVLKWHNQSFGYNLSLQDGHPYASQWWGWFLLKRPIWLYFKDVNGVLVGVDGIGNPLAWWSAIAVIPILIYFSIKGDKTSLTIVGAFMIFWLFWAFFSRVLFLYHAMISFIFLSFGIAYVLDKLFKNPWGRFYAFSYLAILLIIFIFFLPLWIGIPLDSNHFYQRIWFQGWI